MINNKVLQLYDDNGKVKSIDISATVIKGMIKENFQELIDKEKIVLKLEKNDNVVVNGERGHPLEVM